jgi:hypothetical protein
MKYKDITTTEEEVLQSLVDAGIKFEVTNGPTLGEQMEQIEQRIRMIDDLYDIALELDSRETSMTLPVDRLHQLSLSELCDKGIEILEKLKKI